jgi:hypothetical protein
MTDDEFASFIWRVYRRGVIHGGMVAVATAAVWLFIR